MQAAHGDEALPLGARRLPRADEQQQQRRCRERHEYPPPGEHPAPVMPCARVPPVPAAAPRVHHAVPAVLAAGGRVHIFAADDLQWTGLASCVLPAVAVPRVCRKRLCSAATVLVAWLANNAA